MDIGPGVVIGAGRCAGERHGSHDGSHDGSHGDECEKGSF
jgi:hypothetical protein